MADWHKTQTKYRSKSQPKVGQIALILSAYRSNFDPLVLINPCLIIKSLVIIKILKETMKSNWRSISFYTFHPM